MFFLKVMWNVSWNFSIFSFYLRCRFVIDRYDDDNGEDFIIYKVMLVFLLMV